MFGCQACLALASRAGPYCRAGSSLQIGCSEAYVFVFQLLGSYYVASKPNK